MYGYVCVCESVRVSPLVLSGTDLPSVACISVVVITLVFVVQVVPVVVLLVLYLARE